MLMNAKARREATQVVRSQLAEEQLKELDALMTKAADQGENTFTYGNLSQEAITTLKEAGFGVKVVSGTTEDPVTTIKLAWKREAPEGAPKEGLTAEWFSHLTAQAIAILKSQQLAAVEQRLTEATTKGLFSTLVILPSKPLVETVSELKCAGYSLTSERDHDLRISWKV